MLEQNQPEGLIGDIEQYLKEERQLKDALIGQYVASNLETNINPQDEERSAERLHLLFPGWKVLSIKWETDEQKKKILKELTLSDVASFCAQEHQRIATRISDTAVSPANAEWV